MIFLLFFYIDKFVVRILNSSLTLDLMPPETTMVGYGGGSISTTAEETVKVKRAKERGRNR